jgi:uncharacterized protein YceH (UPF0502 family)
MTDDSPSPASPQQAPRWQPLGPIDRRIAGVLVEKAKTVPSAYPMSLNAICTAANQKSNRFPLLDLQPEDAEESLERLRNLGAVGVVQGYGRVAKYRHYLYEWLGVEKAELSVMAELLLRGAQTEGELRAHAARMDPIPDLTALRAILGVLESKGLVTWLTPEGRGRVVSHTLYTPREMESLWAQFGARSPAAMAAAAEDAGPAARPSAGAAPSRAPAPVHEDTAAPAGQLQREVEELRSQVTQLRADVDELTTALRRTEEDLQRLRNELGA